MFPLILLGAAQLAAALAKQQDEAAYKNKQHQEDVIATRRSAIERSLKNPSYLRQPDPLKQPDEGTLDTISGVSQAGQNLNFGAM